IAGSFAVAEQAAFNTSGACQHGKLSTGDSGAAVIVRMHADGDKLQARESTNEVLDLIGEYIRCVALHRGGQVKNERALLAWLPDSGNGFANLQRKFRLGEVERFWRVFQCPLRLWMRVA